MDVKTVQNWLEIGSDVVGALSGILLLIPVLEVSSLKKRLDETRRRILSASSANSALLLKLLKEQQEAVSDYDRVEHRYMKWGAIALIATFILKIAFHWLTK